MRAHVPPARLRHGACDDGHEHALLGLVANTYKLTRGYRFELFYWDYAVGIVLTALFYALTLGTLCTGFTGGSSGAGFLANVADADAINIVYALIAGVIFNIANLLLVAAIEMAGLAIAFPLAIGIALVIGVVLSYAIEPRGNPLVLACGVGLAIVAVIFDGKAYGALKAGTSSSVSRKSIIVCIVSGVLMGSFAPFVTRALTVGHTLGPYSVAVFYTIGALLSCFVVNVYFMKHPLVGEPIDFSGFRAARPVDHLFGVLGGFVWGTGTVFNFVAAGFLGVAISYAIGQAAPMVAAIWGVAVWKEFRGAPSRAWMYLALMFAAYAAALAVLAGAYGSV